MMKTSPNSYLSSQLAIDTDVEIDVDIDTDVDIDEGNPILGKFLTDTFSLFQSFAQVIKKKKTRKKIRQAKDTPITDNDVVHRTRESSPFEF